MNESIAPDPPVTAVEYASRLRALLGKGGVSTSFPRRARDRWILLHAIASRVAPGECLSEVEATGRIGAFLLEWAPHWRMDRVTIRRELVDGGFLDRDANGRDYRRSTRHEARVTFGEVQDPGAILG